MKKRIKAMNKPDLYGRKGPDDIPGHHGGHIENGQESLNPTGDIRDVIQMAVQAIKSATRATRRDFVLMPPPEDAYARPWCSELGVTFLAPGVTKGALNDLGGSKVGETGSRLGPTGSAPGQGGCNQALTRALEGAWKRTFGHQTRVRVQDLEFFPHLTGSHWVPLGPGPSAGSRGRGSDDWVPTLREGPSRTHSPGGGGIHSKAPRSSGPSHGSAR